MTTLPLNSAQQGIWLGQQKVGRNACYNTAELWHLSVDINLQALVTAIAQTLINTSALNARFIADNGELKQVLPLSQIKTSFAVSAPTRSTIANHALLSHQSTLTEVFSFDDIKTMENWQTQSIDTLLDLTNNTPYAHAIFRHPDGHWCYLLILHHIACDGFSYALFARELAKQYTKFNDKQNYAIKHDNDHTRYREFIDADKHYHNNRQFLLDKAFWQRELSAVNAITFKGQTELAAAAPQKGRRHKISLRTGFLSDVKRQAGECGVDWTLYLQALLARYYFATTFCESCCFGIAQMNRTLGADMATPGLAMNIMPLIITGSHKSTQTEIAQQIALKTQEQKQHSRFRYEQLAQVLPAKEKSRRAFGPVINILPFPRALELGGEPVTITPLSAGPVEDIALVFALNANNQLDGYIECHQGLYTEAESSAVAWQLSCWLNSQKSAPYDFSALVTTTTNGPAPAIFATLEHNRKTQAQATAVRYLGSQDDDGNEEWVDVSYQTLCALIADTAQTLAQGGLQDNLVCALALERGLWPVVCAYACLALNAQFLFIDPKGPKERTQAIVKDSQPALIITPTPAWSKHIALTTSAKELPIQTISKYALATKVNTAMAMQVFVEKERSDAPAYGIYTSGSTGRPKGVLIDKAALQAFISSANSIYGINDKDRVLQFAPLTFDACIEEIFITLHAGATLVVRTDAMIDSFDTFNKALAEHDITLLDLPTAFWHDWSLYNQAIKIQISRLIRTVIIGGEACKGQAIDAFFKSTQSALLMNTYGPSEATVVATCKTYTRGNHQSVDARNIGSPLPGRTALIVNEAYHPIAKGIIGQLCLTGQSLATGYHNLPLTTAQQFIDVSIGTSVKRCYLTGDKASINTDGEVIFEGRSDDEIKISGHRINPAEIERALDTVLPNAHASVVSLKTQSGYRIYGFVQTDIGDCIEIDGPLNRGLKISLAQRLPETFVPTSIFSVPKMPTNDNGKVDKKSLKEWLCSYMQHQLKPEKTSLVSSGSLEEIKQVWRCLLGAQEIADNDDFFALGGTSLQLLQVATELSKRLSKSQNRNISVAVSDLFSHPTPRKLGNFMGLEKSTTESQQAVLPLAKETLKLSVELLTSIAGTQFKTSCKQVFITGATGFVGAQLISQIQAVPEMLIICLIRAKTEMEARNKLAKALVQQGLADCSQAENIQVVLGDISQRQLGLDNTDYKALFSKVDCVIHNAAVTSIVRDLQSLKATNVDATAHCLALAANARAPLHYISTIAVAQDEGLPEDFVDCHTGLRDGYQKSKWASEYYLQQARDAGHPVAIYRLPRVVGDPNTGYINSNDLVWRIAFACRRLKLCPELDVNEPWLAVNLAAQCIVNRVLDQFSGVINCVPARYTSLKNLLIQLTRLYDWQGVPFAIWAKALAKSSNSEDLALSHFFENSTGKTHLPKITNTRFIEFIQGTGLSTDLSFEPYICYASNAGLLAPSQTGLHSTDKSLISEANS